MLQGYNKIPASTIGATVISVDIRRKVCKVIADPPSGALLRNIAWDSPVGDTGRSSDSYSPMPRDRVLIGMTTGSYRIVSGTSFSTYDKEHQQFIGARREVDDLEFYQRFNLSNESVNRSAGSARPEDSQPGDRLLTSQGGSIFGILNSGSILAKASSLAQVFISKLDDMVRVVSRNFELFSDASKRIDANAAGDVYSYIEFYRTQESSREEKPDYWEAFGNTLSAESSRGEYVDQVESLGIDTIVKKQAVDHESIRRWTHTLDIAGGSHRASQDAQDNARTTEDFTNVSWGIKTEDVGAGKYTDTSQSSEEYKVSIVDSNGSHLYEGTTAGAKIEIVKGGTHSKFALNADGTTSLDTTTNVVVTTPYAHINSPIIDLGESDLEKVVLGDTMAAWFTTFQLAYSTHTHLGNLGMPTTPPVMAADFTSVLPNGDSYSVKNSTQ